VVYLLGDMPPGVLEEELRSIARQEGCEDEVDWTQLDGLD